MKKQLLTGTAILLFAAASAWAADPAPAIPPAAPAPVTAAAPASAMAPAADTESMPQGKRHQWTIEEARKHAHERAEKLDKMTEAEWNAKQQKSHEWRAKWKAMTPEEKDAYKKMRIAKRHHKEEESATAPASVAPAAGGQ
jgi:Skp family chaperone for outer membrane proteins